MTAGEVAKALATTLLGLEQVPMQVLAQSWAEAVANGNLKMWFADAETASLAAALNPEPFPALYFVARGDGSSEFSSDLAAHNRAVERYQRRGGGS